MNRKERLMKRTYRHGGMILAAIIVLTIGGRAGADEQPPSAPGVSSTFSMARFYTAPLLGVGEFPGRIVRLSCDSNGTPDGVTRCSNSGHALVVDGDTLLHPLLPGTPEVREELNSSQLQETEVKVRG